MKPKSPNLAAAMRWLPVLLFLALSAPAEAVARTLLPSTKNVLALPGRRFDVPAPGWQREHFRMTLGRGYGGHRNVFPWVQANPLTGILALKTFDRELFNRLAAPE